MDSFRPRLPVHVAAPSHFMSANMFALASSGFAPKCHVVHGTVRNGLPLGPSLRRARYHSPPTPPRPPKPNPYPACMQTLARNQWTGARNSKKTCHQTKPPTSATFFQMLQQNFQAALPRCDRKAHQTRTKHLVWNSLPCPSSDSMCASRTMAMVGSLLAIGTSKASS